MEDIKFDDLNKVDIKKIPAFPDEYSDGMTLRDYFAAKAMQGELSSGCQNVENDEDLVKYSYSIADLMLLERSK